MAHVSVTGVIHAPADMVWRTISDFGAVPQWLGAVHECEADGNGPGAVRKLIMGDGGVAVQRLDRRDGTARSLSYTTLEWTLAPVTNYAAVMTVREVDSGACVLEWSASYDPGDAPEPALEQIFRGMFNLGIAGLRKLHEP